MNGHTQENLLERANHLGARGMSALADTLTRAEDYVSTHAAEYAQKMEWSGADEQISKLTTPLSSAAEYLRSQDPRGAAQDLDQAVQAHPWKAVLIGFGLGYLVSKIL